MTAGASRPTDHPTASPPPSTTSGNGSAEHRQRDERRDRERHQGPVAAATRPPIRSTAWTTIATHGRGEAQEQPGHQGGVALRDVQPGERRAARRSPGSTNRTPGDQAAEPSVEQPAGVDRQLLGLRTRQQHAVAEGVQEPPLTDPARSSTSSRCITAIWPAGPPKVCSEIRNHARVASRSGTTCAGVAHGHIMPANVLFALTRPVAGCVACLEPTSPGTRPPPAPPSWTSRRTPSTWTSRRATRPSARPPRSSSPAPSPAPRPSPTSSTRVHEITLNGESLDPATAYADSRIALPDLAADNKLVVRADLPYSRTGEGLHRFVDPVDDRVYLYSPVRGAGRPPRLHHLRAARPQGAVHLHRDRARPLEGRLQLADPRAERARRPARPCGASRRPSRCRRTSPPSSPASTTRSSTPTRASTATSRSATTAASRSSSTSTSRCWSSSPSRASTSSRTHSTSPTPSASTTSSTCRSTTWARWRTPAA